MHRHCDDSDTPLDELLKGHAAVNLPFSADNELCQLITVSRRRIWSDIKRAFSKPYTNLNLPVRIIFSGEEAVDDGGPRSDYLTCGLDGVQVSVNDIPDATIRDKLNQVSF